MRSKKEEKLQARLEKFGVDFENYSFDELRRRNAETVNDIANTLAGTRLYSVGSILGGDANTAMMMELTRALVEQNFVLIRQNEEIARCLKLIYGKL